jgi:hypothetical protein
MAHESYRNCTIISNGGKLNNGLWTPYVTVICRVKNTFEPHELSARGKSFKTEAEAIAYGFTIAREWIEKTL